MADAQSTAPSRPSAGAPSSGVTHIRTRLTAHFTVLANRLTQRAGSAVTVGVAAYILSLPDGVPITIDALCAHFAEGETRISRALRELEAEGWLERRVERAGDGRIVTRTFVYDLPGAAGAAPVRAPSRPADRAPQRVSGPVSPARRGAPAAPSSRPATASVPAQRPAAASVPAPERHPGPPPLPGPASASGPQPEPAPSSAPHTPAVAGTAAESAPLPPPGAMPASGIPGILGAAPRDAVPVHRATSATGAEPPSAPPGPAAVPAPQRPTAPVAPEATALLSGLRHHDSRLLLSEREVAALAPAVADWLARGTGPAQITATLTAHLPDRFTHRPARLVAHRLAAFRPPEPAPVPAPPRVVPLQECPGCDRPFRAERPGHCRDCRRRDEGRTPDHHVTGDRAHVA
ncbi:hypothetical protein ABT112_27635 [Streptomyces sp. NPDC002055]|uniref:hypothetical protein n=1 Tax=Streptomyces sp. NPDC002055 TaxID=3154534 RepID=UPI003324F044